MIKDFIDSELKRLLNSYNYKVEYMRCQDSEDEYYGDMEIILIIATVFYLKELFQKEHLTKYEIDFVNKRELIYDDETLDKICIKYKIDINKTYTYDEVVNFKDVSNDIELHSQSNVDISDEMPF